ncbi:hypothetical protein ACU4GD_07790 [Cupriavidus basilensis]
MLKHAPGWGVASPIADRNHESSSERRTVNPAVPRRLAVTVTVAAPAPTRWRRTLWIGTAVPGCAAVGTGGAAWPGRRAAPRRYQPPRALGEMRRARPPGTWRWVAGRGIPDGQRP